MTINYSVVIPVYRGSKTIVPLFEQIKLFFDQRGSSFEVIFVFDNGPDQSWQVIQSLKATYQDLVKGIRLSRNYGQHNATICGFKYASGEYIITMDEDLQHSPADIGLLIAQQSTTGADVVYGIYAERRHSAFRNLTSYIMNKLLKAGIPDLHPDYSAFRLLRAPIAKATLGMSNSYTFLDGYLTWITTYVASVRVSHMESQAGASSYSIRKLVEHSVNIFVTFSSLPIRLLTMSSILFLIFSASYSVYILLRSMLYHDLAMGFPTLTIISGFGFGFTMFGLGLLGEYIQRINLKTTKRPNFIESEQI